jgi:hypothetical protein
MATDRHNRQSGIIELQRKLLPYSADIRDAPTSQLLAARYWTDNTASLVPAEQQIPQVLGGGTRGWIFGADPPAGHYMRVDTAIAKRPDPDAASGFVYAVTAQREWWERDTNTVMRTGTLFPDAVDPERVWVSEEIVVSFTKAEAWRPETVAATESLLLAAIASTPGWFELPNRATVGNPRVHGYAFFSVPNDARHFPDGPGEPPLRPDAPILYTVTKASGIYRNATNLTLAYDEATTEREVAVLRGVV